MEGRALFLGRDGAVNREAGDVYRKEDVQFVEGIFSLCRTAKKLGYRLVVITHQKGLARGVYSEADYSALMKWMREEFRREGIALDGVYHTPSPKARGAAGSKGEHEGDKLGAGMLRRSSRDLHLNLSESVMVGVRCTGVVAANAAGLHQTFLLQGTEQKTCKGVYTAVNSLAEVEAWLIEHEKAAGGRPAR